MGTELFAQEFFNCLISSETSNRFALSNYFTEAYSRGYDFCGKIPYELCHKSVTVTSPFSYEVTGLGALCLLHTDTDDELHGIIRSRMLADFFAQLYLLQSVERTGFFHIPSYIADMQRRFNTEYDMPYSLDELAEEYNVNKFRLCREFAKYYDVTPMQYLNNIRMDKARELLLHSDKKVVEIGQLIGIENTNSFIRLFKEKNGVTPLTYRRETPVL